jgi:hypothetical protein
LKEIERLKRKFSSNGAEQRQAVGAARQLQLMLLQRMIRLCKVLQREVPVPVGCNNPACLNMQGVAELKTACKVCLGCHVARYCGRECQQVHWKDHMKVCKQMQQHQRS